MRPYAPLSLFIHILFATPNSLRRRSDRPVWGKTVDDVGGDVLSFLEQDNPKSCAGCDLANADLTGANLDKANLTDVIGADFTGAGNVSPKYR